MSNPKNPRNAGRKPSEQPRKHNAHIRMNDAEYEAYQNLGEDRAEKIRDFIKSQA